MLLFVYGTLRRGEANHPRMGGARFVGVARTEARYELADLGGFPALLEQGHTSVVGELYDVDGALLSELDEFEDVPTLYERKTIALAKDPSRGEATSRAERSPLALAYVMCPERADQAPRIIGGDWRGEAAAGAT